MTREDHYLAHYPIAKDEIKLYRLVKAEHANLSGIGAALYPGRWNVQGQEAIYTSVEQGVPVLEKLVHTTKQAIPKNLAMMAISLKKHEMSSLWEHPNRRANSLRRAKQIYSKNLVLDTAFAFAVPSVIVPVWNVVLYPGAPGFWDHVSIENIEPFDIDPRLFPESAT